MKPGDQSWMISGKIDGFFRNLELAPNGHILLLGVETVAFVGRLHFYCNEQHLLIVVMGQS